MQSNPQQQWQEQSYRSFGQGQENRAQSMRNLRDRSRSVQQDTDPESLEHAFRLLKQGIDAENEGRYRQAAKLFYDSGAMLSSVSYSEPDEHTRDFIGNKSDQVLSWCEALIEWLDNGSTGPVPKRMGTTVPCPLVGRILETDAVPPRPDDPEEFQCMFYTSSSTKNIKNFRNEYPLRCMLQNRPPPSLMVVITMYNEDDNELKMTMRKVANNVNHLRTKQLPGYMNDEAWQKILVCIVSDGRTKANPKTLSWLSKVGLYDEKALTINSVGTDVQMHLFEYSLKLLLDVGKETSQRANAKYDHFPPLQTVFALKEHNGGKLNSHEWYFNAFAELIQPEYTVLLDVGTMPTKSAFYRLLNSMTQNKKIGGVCGEIAVDKPIPNLGNFVIAAQHYEYKISNILDKSLESVFGFISVLPGAFSAYRYEAIRGAPLEAYFKSLTTPMKELGPFQGNMYLAEDRILCFEIVARNNSDWTLHYVKNAIARTDVPTDLVSLIGQRRRWLNGSFFAILYTIRYWGRIFSESNHSMMRKSAFMVQYLFNVITVILSWFLISNFYLAIYFVVIAGMNNDQWGPYLPDTKKIPQTAKDIISVAFQLVYGLLFLLQIIVGLGNKPKHIPWVYTVSAIFYGVVMVIAFFVALLVFAGGEFSLFTVLFATAIVGVYFIAGILHCEIHHICFAFFQYFALLPTTVNVLTVYSFCNLHDLSWGTKGLEGGGGHGPKAEETKGNYADVLAAQKAAEEAAKKAAQEKDDLEKQFSGFRSQLLYIWLFSNLVYTAVIQVTLSDNPNPFLSVLYVVVGFFNIWRFIGSTLYLFTYVSEVIFGWVFLKRTLERKNKQKEREEQQHREMEAGYNGVATPQGVSPHGGVYNGGQPGVPQYGQSQYGQSQYSQQGGRTAI